MFRLIHHLIGKYSGFHASGKYVDKFCVQESRKVLLKVKRAASCSVYEFTKGYMDDEIYFLLYNRKQAPAKPTDLFLSFFSGLCGAISVDRDNSKVSSYCCSEKAISNLSCFPD